MPRRATPAPPSAEAPVDAQAADPVGDHAAPTTEAEATAAEATAARAEKPSEKPPEIKPTLVLFVRHGRTPTTGATLPGRAPGLSLADAGREQAEAVAAHIGELKRVDAVYASPLERTRETAAPIAKARKLRVVRERGLLEC